MLKLEETDRQEDIGEKNERRKANHNLTDVTGDCHSKP